MTLPSEVIIVGGGVMGCATAYYLAKQGIGSTVFEQNSFGSGASGATAGVIGPLWHVPHENEAFFKLSLKSLHMFPILASEMREIGLDLQYRQSGVLHVAFDEDRAADIKRGLIWQSRLDMDVKWLDAQEVISREPNMNPKVLGGVYSPQEGYINGQHLVDTLVLAGAYAGVRFVDKTEVFGLEIVSDRVVGIRIASGVVEASHVVLASGPWAGIAKRWIYQDVPIRPIKGQRIVLRMPGLAPKSPIHGSLGYCVPQIDTGILVAATRHDGEFDHMVTADGLASMISAAIELYPKLSGAYFDSARVGVRPGTPDDVPIIGPVPGIDSLSIVSGHDAVGVMTAPSTANALAEYIESGNADHLESFSLARFTDS